MKATAATDGNKPTAGRQITLPTTTDRGKPEAQGVYRRPLPADNVAQGLLDGGIVAWNLVQTGVLHTTGREENTMEHNRPEFGRGGGGGGFRRRGGGVPSVFQHTQEFHVSNVIETSQRHGDRCCGFGVYSSKLQDTGGHHSSRASNQSPNLSQHIQ